MGKALFAVGSFLVLCMAVLGTVVFLTREEDRIAVDNLLAERISREFVVAAQAGDPLDLTRITPFQWDHVLVYPVGTPRSTVSDALGYEFKGDLSYTAESSEVFVFVDRAGQVARFADYRGRGRFEGLDRPIDQLSAPEAVFTIRDGVARPAPAG